MKKIQTILIVALLFSVTAKAQMHFGVKGGLNLVNTTFDGSYRVDYHVADNTGFFFGPTVKLDIPFFFLAADASLIYSQTSSDIESRTIRNHTLAVPANVRFSPVPVLPVFIFGGPQFDVTIGKNRFELENAIIALKHLNYKNANVSMNLGVGVEFPNLQFTINYNMALGNRARYSAFRYEDSPVTHSGKANTNIWQLSVAFFY